MAENTRESSFTFGNPEAMDIFVYRWEPAGGASKAAVLIAHGAAEHALRYQRVARFLSSNGYSVYALDHRGHGKSAARLADVGWAGPDGWNGMLRDLKQLSGLIGEENPGRRLFLLGHSMGSYLAQRYIQLWGKELKGTILSGSSGAAPGLAEIIPFMEAAAEGEAARQPSAVLGQTFADFNRPFTPGETGLEWLSRDEAEVRKYVDDPWCGFAFSNRLVADMFKGMHEAWQPENEASIPVELPLLVFSGSLDPVSGAGKTVKELVRRYRDLGIRNLKMILYPDGRHEMLNEINRDQVHGDIVAWLDEHLG